MLCRGHIPRLYGLATACRRLEGFFRERLIGEPESGLTRPPSAMQRRHCDDSRWAFPMAAPHSDIAPKEALAPQPERAELHVEKPGRIGCYKAGRPIRPRVRQVKIGGDKRSTRRRCQMQTPLLGATALALVAAVNLSSAWAEGQKPSGRSSWSGISQSVERDADSAHSASPSFKGARPQGTSQKG